MTTDSLGAPETAARDVVAPLGFGPAGWRAPIGPGPDEMNVQTVTRITAGVARWMRQATAPRRRDGRFAVAVGHDARYGSQPMARTVAETFAGAGFEVTLVAEPAPTAVVEYLVRSRGLDAGVQITGSHCSATMSGYRLFCAGGSPVSEAAAEAIERAISAQPAAFLLPRSEAKSLDFGAISAYVHFISGPVATGEQRVVHPRRTLRVVYTPLHGVGGSALEDALRANGFGDVHSVPCQRWPDPEFPTVDVPDPLRPGVTDELLRHGEELGADLLVALSPDADRCVVGSPISLKDATPARFTTLSQEDTAAVLGRELGEDGVATAVLAAARAAVLKQQGRTLWEEASGR
ncbi:hypothetical protein [Corynebacterium heidelbergense]|uniref:Phosphomannomutase n=1 Tax=Corynebacterium heidelbergense TaxID=2055947 RepID=A0A364VDV3_9CORY|nr:hypothetical protein [Corynebacterium heidelbergense]RAV34798.1 hypothetical protein CWC39_01275 [Corynebacterium heidelbergense]